MDVALRRLQADDISQVSEIEREAFAPMPLGTPFKRELSNRYAKYYVAWLTREEEEEPFYQESRQESRQEPPADLPGDTSLWGRMVRSVQGVIKRDQAPNAFNTGNTEAGNIAGYVGVWFQGNEAHITEIAVRENLRGNGIGELLLIGSVRAAVAYGSTVVTLEARVSNFIAQRLYEKYGFKSAGIRKGYYSDNREDAVIMTTGLIHSLEYQQLFRELQEAYLSRWREISIDD